MQIVAGAKDSIDEAQSAGTEQHERLTAQPVYGVKGDDGEHKVGDAGDYDVKEHVANLIASLLEDLLGIVEDDIRATPLLEDGDEDAKNQDGSVAPGKQGRKTASVLCSRGVAFMSTHLQPSRTLGNEQAENKKDGGREHRHPKHPAPSHLSIPRLGDSGLGHPRRHRLGNEPVDNLGGKDADDDHHLVERHHAAADGRRCYFGDIHRRESRGQADADTTKEAGDEEGIETKYRTRGQSRQQKNNGG